VDKDNFSSYVIKIHANRRWRLNLRVQLYAYVTSAFTITKFWVFDFRCAVHIQLIWRLDDMALAVPRAVFTALFSQSDFQNSKWPLCTYYKNVTCLLYGYPQSFPTRISRKWAACVRTNASIQESKVKFKMIGNDKLTPGVIHINRACHNTQKPVNNRHRI
jgi:hypothetical protein